MLYFFTQQILLSHALRAPQVDISPVMSTAPTLTPANEEEPHPPLDHHLACEFGQPIRWASAVSPWPPGPPTLLHLSV